jgi:hypothetical protein
VPRASQDGEGDPGQRVGWTLAAIYIAAVRHPGGCLPQTSHRSAKEDDGAHARIRSGDLFLTKEVLRDHFSHGGPLRSNAEAICNKRCLAALPRNPAPAVEKLLEHSELIALNGGLPARRKANMGAVREAVRDGVEGASAAMGR